MRAGLLFAVLSAMALLSPAHAREPARPLRAMPDERTLVLTFSDNFDTCRTFDGTLGDIGIKNEFADVLSSECIRALQVRT